MFLNYLISACIGYLLGTSNMAYFISKIKKVDLRSGGSGNLGASNATIMMGKSAGVIVLIHDALKAILAIVICSYLFPTCPYVKFVAGISSVLGHIYPFYLYFKGGKGFASYIGMILGLNWKFALIMILIIIVVSLLANWIVAGTFSTILITPLFFFVTQGSIPFFILMIGTICIFFKHIENIKRKMVGQESKVTDALFKKK